MSGFDCCICLEECKLPFTLSCSHTFCFLCLKRVWESGLPYCPLCRKYINREEIEKASNGTLEIKPENELWLYSGRHEGFWVYDLDSQEKLNEGYNNYLLDNENETIALEILGREYTINFNQMTQTYRGAVRKIKKCLPDNKVKGIAGLNV